MNVLNYALVKLIFKKTNRASHTFKTKKIFKANKIT